MQKVKDNAMGSSGWSRVALVGVGTIGTAWAAGFAARGCTVQLYDRQMDVAKEALARAGDMAMMLGCAAPDITIASSLQDALADAQYVQESIVEDLAEKRAIHEAIAGLVPAGAAIGSSTSEFQGSHFLNGLATSARSLVVHPINPPSLLPLVELCPTTETSEDTVRAVRSFLASMGKSVVALTREVPGFVLNRLQAALLNEAWHLVRDGICTPEDIDLTVTAGLGLRWAAVGPFLAGHLNAPGGYLDYMSRYGGTWRRLVESLGTAQPPEPELVAKIAASCGLQLGGQTIAEAQAERDSRLLALLQALAGSVAA